MRIYFIRHGHPNYDLDCLTDIGRLQAEACSERLKDESIRRVFSSSKGRAIETAEYTAKKLELEVEPLDFMREIRWHSKTDTPIFKGGNPWHVVEDMILNGESILDGSWEKTDRFSQSVVGDCVNAVAKGLDEWLRGFGYEREGDYYRVTGDNTKQTVAVFSHGGSSSAALSHLFGVAFPWVCQVIRTDFTSVTAVDLGDDYGTLTFPQLTLLNDARHINGIEDRLS